MKGEGAGGTGAHGVTGRGAGQALVGRNLTAPGPTPQLQEVAAGGPGRRAQHLCYRFQLRVNL